MHAGHERVLYERLKNAGAQASPASQGLLQPIELTLRSAEIEALRAARSALEAAGFGFDGDADGADGTDGAEQGTLVVTRVPAALASLDVGKLLRELAGVADGSDEASHHLDGIGNEILAHARVSRGRSRRSPPQPSGNERPAS